MFLESDLKSIIMLVKLNFFMLVVFEDKINI